MNFLRQLFIKKKIQNKLLENVEFSKVEFKGKQFTFLILVGEDEVENSKEFIANELGIPIHNITLLGFCKSIKKAEIVEELFSPNDFGLFGKIKSEKLKKIVDTEFDFLLNYTTDVMYIDYITSMSNAIYKVGYSNSDVRLYDLMIDLKKPNISIFTKELNKYIKIINR